VKTRNVTDLVYFDDDAARTEVLHETGQLFSQVICLQEAQGVGPMRDADADGLVVVLAGEVAAQVGKGRARMRQWESVTVAAGDELTIRNASDEPSVVLLVLAPPPA
jgi:quercetin dioxygenase-like cupin family protein